MNAVIIGSGISGLTAALYLQRAGYDVALYEQGPEAGGVTASLRKDGYSWDLGQLLLEGLGPGEQVGEILADLGIADRLELIRDHRAYVFPDFRVAKPHMQAVFTSILADFVVRPSRFPGLAVPAVNPEPAFDRSAPLALSRWGRQPSYHYIRGGVGALARLMHDEIAKRGGHIHTSRPIDRIVVEQGRAHGVVCADGEHVAADLVLASGGARESLVELAGRKHFDAAFLARVDDLPLMESIFMVHLGIDFDPTPHQPETTCYYYGTYDVEAAVEALGRGRYHEGRDGFVVYVPSRHSPEMAPPGHHAITIYTVAPNVLDQGTWHERKEELTDKLLVEAERFIPGLREHTRVRVVLTPDDWRERTHLVHHSFGGVAPVMDRPGVPHVTPVAGLYFIGAQSESGAGVNNVMQGVWRTIRGIEAG
jgi:phytoene dehydrogenase-like protein